MPCAEDTRQDVAESPEAKPVFEFLGTALDKILNLCRSYSSLKGIGADWFRVRMKSPVNMYMTKIWSKCSLGATNTQLRVLNSFRFRTEDVSNIPRLRPLDLNLRNNSQNQQNLLRVVAGEHNICR
jgi:hypothetical protein